MESPGCVQTHELETPKLPLSATAPAGEHGGTAHALQGARRMRNHGPPNQAHGSWVFTPGRAVDRGRSQAGMHLEHTPGYGDTPPCRASEAAEGPLRGCRSLIAPASPCPPRAACFPRAGALARFLGGDKGGLRFNDSTGVGRLPRSRLKIESLTFREGGSGTCVARAGSPGAVAGGWGSSAGIPMARGIYKGRAGHIKK